MPADEAPIEAPPPAIPSRRDDIESKQEKIARLLGDSGCDYLLLLEPGNYRWFTSGSGYKGLQHADAPILFANAQQRWLLCSNIDTQRYFDEELDGLGFQVKEWPWHGSREQFLADLVFGRKVASDLSFRDCKDVSAFLETERRRLSKFEQERARELGRLAAHALEATARNVEPGDTEEEVAGHLAHRLLRHGVEPFSLRVSADERSAKYRRAGASAEPIRKFTLLQATAAKFGLYVTASRSISFGEPGEEHQREFEMACRLHTYWLTSIKVGDRASTVSALSKNVLRSTPFEHEWRLSPPGWLTGRRPSEALFTPASPERFSEGRLVVWQAQIGAASVCDTYLVQENGWNSITAVEEWPVRRYVIQGARIECPDLLIQNPA